MADNNMDQAVASADSPKARVIIGARRFLLQGWKRKDAIFLGEDKIGFIRLSSTDRAGETVSTITGKTTKGRAANWCVEEAMSVRLAGVQRKLRAA